MGINEMIKQLVSLGYQPSSNGSYVCFEYTVPHGRFRNQKIELALEAGQFPLIPPSGPNIKPFLLPIKPEAGAHPFCGIHQRNTPTSEYQYWSRPFPGWDETEKDMKVYLSFLRTLFDFE